MAEARAEFEEVRWVRGDGEDVGGDGVAWKHEGLCGHWPWNLSFIIVASCLK